MVSLSIVVPLYNMEKTVKRTLDDLFEQVKKTDDIEVICVDDCSTDNTLEILKGYPNITIIELKERVSTGKCRNIGLSEASKEFVEFLDGDDLLDLATVRNAIDFMQENSLDICIAEYEKLDIANNRIISEHNGIHFSMGNKDRYIIKTKDILFTLYQVTNSATWNKVYRKEFLDKHDLKFSDCVYAEDMAFTDSCLTCSSKIGFLKENMIVYTHPSTNPNSNDKNSVNTWNDLFTSLEVTHSKILSKKDSLSAKDYSLLLKSFLQCCVDNIEYQYKKFDEPNKEFTEISMKYLDNISNELDLCIEEMLL